MHAYSRTAIDFAGRTWGPGVFACSDAEYHALALRGPCRPATAEETTDVRNTNIAPPPAERTAPENVRNTNIGPEAAALAAGAEQAVARRSAPLRQRAAGALKIPA